MSRPAPLPLHCAEFGEGPPLLVLHGLFGSSANWRTLARRLAHQRRVLTLDLRNHGASPWAEEMSYPALAADVAAFMRDRGLASATLLGHSMGGKTAMVLALSQPRLVERLIVIDIAPVAYAHSHRVYIEAMRSLDATALARRAQADAALSTAVPDAGVRAFLLQNLVQRDGRLRWRVNLAALAAAMDDLIGFPETAQFERYAGPALFVRGERSDYVLPEHLDSIRRLFPHAQIATLPGAGHWLHTERPDALLARVETFLGAR